MGAKDIVERIEAEGGSINTATGYERTSFDVRGLDSSLPWPFRCCRTWCSVQPWIPPRSNAKRTWSARRSPRPLTPRTTMSSEMAQTRAFAGQSLRRPIKLGGQSETGHTRGDLGMARPALFA